MADLTPDVVAEWERKYAQLKADYLRAADLKAARMATIVDLESRLIAATKRNREYEEEEASCCPEDVGFKEWIGVLTNRAERAEAECAELRTFILGLDAHKCGEEYLAVNDMQRKLEAK